MISWCWISRLGWFTSIMSIKPLEQSQAWVECLRSSSILVYTAWIGGWTILAIWVLCRIGHYCIAEIFCVWTILDLRGFWGPHVFMQCTKLGGLLNRHPWFGYFSQMSLMSPEFQDSTGFAGGHNIFLKAWIYRWQHSSSIHSDLKVVFAQPTTQTLRLCLLFFFF